MRFRECCGKPMICVRTCPYDYNAPLNTGAVFPRVDGAEAPTQAVSDTKIEQIDHPIHYGGKSNPYEAIKVIEAWGLGFCLGNCVKYIARAGKKGDAIEDLAKARWYLDREINNRQAGDDAKTLASDPENMSSKGDTK